MGKLNKIDDILRQYEDWMHGEDAVHCTEARRLVADLQNETDLNIYKGKTREEVTDLIYTLHLQNTNGRESPEEMFKLGIEVAYDELKRLNEPKTFEQCVLPAIKFLCENYDPHTKILINQDRAELLMGYKESIIKDFIPD